MKPKKVNILGKEYSIKYVNNPAEVDRNQRESLWGQIDYWKREIRIYGSRKIQDIWDTIIHEILHGIDEELHLELFNSEAGEILNERLSMALTDVLFRNNFLRR